MEASLIYVWHDCFVYKSDNCIIVFDYWRDSPDNNIEPLLQMIVRLSASAYPMHLPVYVLVSHHHKDHFNREVLTWWRHIHNIHYIISKDTAKSINYILKPNSTYNGNLKVSADIVTILKEGERYSDDVLQVTAFGSTDIGNSYIVEVDGRILFHAGDLNAWIWKNESTKAEVQEALTLYYTKINEIKGAFPKIDYAMFPVDKRMGRDWWEGAWCFVNLLKVSNFIPMHFCLYEDEEQRHDFEYGATAFALYANPTYGHYCAMTVSGEELRLNTFS